MEIYPEKTDVGKMTDTEIEALASLPELIEAARVERERRRIEADPDSRFVDSSTSRTARRVSDAACPVCGKHDGVIDSKTMYETGLLARGGEPVGTAAYCRCGAVYDARTGKPVEPGRDFYSY